MVTIDSSSFQLRSIHPSASTRPAPAAVPFFHVLVEGRRVEKDSGLVRKLWNPCDGKTNAQTSEQEGGMRMRLAVSMSPPLPSSSGRRLFLTRAHFRSRCQMRRGEGKADEEDWERERGAADKKVSREGGNLFPTWEECHYNRSRDAARRSYIASSPLRLPSSLLVCEWIVYVGRPPRWMT